MKRKKVESFSTQVNTFLEQMKHHVDVLSVTTSGKVTTIKYEDWTEHPRIINTKRKKHPDELGYYPTTSI